MDRPRNASPPLAAHRALHHRPPPSPALHSVACDGDEDRPSPTEEKPSGPVMDGHHDGDDGERASHKKPRHRHSPTQLAALNALFDRGEHPTLDERTELAERLGMQTKTVSAWFQNKRASTKKRNKPAPANLPSIANLLNAPHPPQRSPQPPHAPSPRRSRQKDLHLNDHILADPLPTVPRTQDVSQEAALESSFFAGPSEFFPQERFVLSHHRGRGSEEGAVPQLRNAGSDRVLPDTDSRFVSENDVLPPRRARNDVARTRTSPEQAEELRRAYARNDHPTREQRQQLADKIGMHLKSVTNWFQNQRSQAKKQRELSSVAPPVSARPSTGGRDRLSTLRIPPHPPLPPRSGHPSLSIPDHDPRPVSLKLPSASIDDYREPSSSRSRTSLPPSLSSRMSSPRTRTSVAPYARDSKDLHTDEGRHCDNSSESTKIEDPLARPRRSRPEPHQLDALRKLLHRTLTPSMEERNALALEVGMDVGKVTNWFRNIRQNARKRGKRSRVSATSANLHEYEASSGSSVYDDDDAMDLIHEDLVDQEMDDRSDDDYQEAVTPFTDVSSSPPPNKQSRPHLPADDGVEPMDVDFVKPSDFREFRKVVGMTPMGGSSDYDLGTNAMTYSGVKVEDALLLLSFHQHVVH